MENRIKNFLLKKITRLLFLFLIATMFFFSSCTVQDVEVGEIQGIKVNELTTKSVELDLQIPINNKNNFSFKIKKVNLEIELNGSVLGTITEARNVKIPANSNETHHFYLNVDMSKVVSGSINVLASLMSKQKTGVKIKGYIKAKAFMVSEKIYIEENRPINIFKGMK